MPSENIKELGRHINAGCSRETVAIRQTAFRIGFGSK